MLKIHQKFKDLRQLKGISQRQLSQQTGISNAMISMIESGKSDPSVGTLRTLLNGLNVSMSAFFSDDFTPQPQVFFAEADMVEIGRNKISYKEVAAQFGNRNLQLLVECYQPGSDTGKAMLSHKGEEAGVIISGKLQVIVGEQTKVLSAGDAYQFNSETPHRFSNPFTDECRLISACTPPSF